MVVGAGPSHGEVWGLISPGFEVPRLGLKCSSIVVYLGDKPIPILTDLREETRGRPVLLISQPRPGRDPSRHA